jgi:hypothetical protein
VSMFNDDFSSSDYTASNDRIITLMNSEYVRILEEVVVK